jgi:hypothetical protein
MKNTAKRKVSPARNEEIFKHWVEHIYKKTLVIPEKGFWDIVMKFGPRASGAKRNKWLKDSGYESGKIMLDGKKISVFVNVKLFNELGVHNEQN